MKAVVRSLAGVLVALVLGLTLAGCSPPPEKVYPVSGRLLDNGKALAIPTDKLPPGELPIRVEFDNTLEGGKHADAYPATVNFQDGTFTVDGHNGKGIPAGKYRITMTMGPFGQDKFNGAFAIDRSPLAVEVPTTGEVVIDVTKKTVK
jgi:hypothetical protein